MKIKALLLVLTVLFSSCYSYKSFDLEKDHFEVSKRYKIDMQNNKTWKGKLLWANDSLVALSTLSKKQVALSLSEIGKVRKGKLSTGKTVGLAATLVGVTVGLVAVISLNNWGTDFGNIDYQF